MFETKRFRISGSVFLTLKDAAFGAAAVFLCIISLMKTGSVQLNEGDLIGQALQCMSNLFWYILPCLIALLIIRFALKPKQYVFRKLLHFVAFSCTSYSILKAQSWLAAVICFMAVSVLVYPVIALADRYEWFKKLLVEKEPGEIKLSLMLLFSTVAVIAAVGWGVFGNRPASAAAVLMWGCGDAAAALVGIPWGRHRLNVGFERGKKSLEGTVADFAVSFASGMIFLCVYEGMSPERVLLPALLAAAAGAIVELLSPSKYDTVTVPAAVLAALLALLR